MIRQARSLAATAFLLVLIVSANWAADSKGAPAQTSTWTSQNLEAFLVQEISGGQAKRVAKEGTILVIRGVFKPAEGQAATLPVGSIVLEGQSTVGETSAKWKLGVIGVGIDGGKGCGYEFPDTVVKGEITTSHDTGGAFSIQKEAENAPALLKIVRHPTTLCLAFNVPQAPSGDVRLRFGDLQTTVSVPDKQ